MSINVIHLREGIKSLLISKGYTNVYEEEIPQNRGKMPTIGISVLKGKTLGSVQGSQKIRVEVDVSILVFVKSERSEKARMDLLDDVVYNIIGCLQNNTIGDNCSGLFFSNYEHATWYEKMQVGESASEIKFKTEIDYDIPITPEDDLEEIYNEYSIFDDDVVVQTDLITITV